MMKKRFGILSALLIFSLAAVATPARAATQIAFFAGGCFWCVEHDLEKLSGVTDVQSGFMGGKEANPAYKDVARGLTGHRETVQVAYDDTIISYQELLSAFWRLHDPSDASGSFVDRGRQYGSAIYYATQEQKRLAEGAKKALQASGKFSRPIATEIAPAGRFYPAPAKHQDYAKRHELKYSYYRKRSGRDQFIRAHWKGDERIYQLKALLDTRS